MIYQVDLGEDILEYNTVTREGPLNGEIKSIDDLYYGINKLLQHHKTERVDLVLRYIRLKGTRSSGLCPKSYPKSELSTRLLGKLNICLGGENGTELVHFPFDGTIMDQPNLFIEAFYVWVDELSRYIREKQKTTPNENRR